MSDAVTITGIAAGGDGVGRLPDGRAVFVPRTAPGERVRLRGDGGGGGGESGGGLKLHKNFARGEVGEIVEAAAARVTAPCPHYGQDRCGGCQLQHLTYDAQLAAKRTIVGDALRRIGKLDVPDPEIVEAVEEWRYRAKITMAVKGAGGGGGRSDGRTVGLHPYDRPGDVFALTDCHIADFRLMALWRDVKPHLDLLPPRLSRLTLRLDREGRRHVIAESAGEPWQTAERLRAAVPDGAAVVCWWQPVDGAEAARARVVAGPSAGFPATAFEQVNPEMEALARRWAVDQLGDVRGRTVWDLYGGIGDTAALLADRGADVVTVDADETAIAWARRRGLPASARCVAGRAEDVLATLPPAHAVVVNPPRGGLHWDVVLRFTGDPVARLVYMSCDPATLARDLHRLSVNYRVAAVKAFDLFPQTAHVESVVVLEAA
jgi:23S rRNA (uracil1939-C5)-methyltransferase